MSKKWYPIVDKEKCKECLICVNFCKNSVYDIQDSKAVVVNPDNCVEGCHGCSKKCSAGAISYFGDIKENELCECSSEMKGGSKVKMNVKVLGTGCSTCQKLYRDVNEVISELSIDADIEKIEDLQKIMSYGIMSVPALIVNEKLKFSGKSPNKEELKKFLTEDIEPEIKCSCGGNC